MSTPQSAAAPPPADTRFALVLTTIFLVVVATGMAFHEIWRDEWQAWMFARDSPSVPAMIHAMRYEGHPPGWHLLLFALSRVTRDVIAMQLLHLGLAAAAVWTLVRHAPFSRVQKTLFAFGYFPAFEYAVISRGYVLGMLALFSACAAWPARRRTYLPIALWLAVLALSSMHGAVLALAFGAAIVTEWALDPEARTALRGRARSTIAAVTIALASVVLAAALARPPADAEFDGRPSIEAAATPVAAARSVALIPVSAYVPFPRMRDGVPVWGETAIVAGPGLPNAPIVGFVIIAILLAVTARRPAALGLFVAGLVGLLVFALEIHFGYMRHWGHVLLLTTAALWLAGLPGRDAGPTVHLGRRWARLGSATFTAVLTVQVVSSGALYVAEIRHPFTQAASAARTLERHGARDGVPLAATHTAYASALAGYLDVPVTYLDDRTTGTYVVWGSGRVRTPIDSIVPRAARLLGPRTPAVLLATDRPLPPAEPGEHVVETLPGDERPHLTSERYYLYRLSRRSGR